MGVISVTLCRPLHSAIQRHQSPERLVLSQFSGFMQLQIQGREIALNGLHPGGM